MERQRDAKGHFLPGHKGLKPKGAVMKLDYGLREKLSVFLMEKSKELPGLWKRLNDHDKARLFIDIAAFVIPKQKDISVTSMNQPTQDAIAKVFDFGNPEDVQLWVDDTREKAFPKVSGDK